MNRIIDLIPAEIRGQLLRELLQEAGDDSTPLRPPEVPEQTNYTSGQKVPKTACNAAQRRAG